MTTQTIDLTNAAPSLSPQTLHQADPCTIVIFGASGDLARRKLIPALFELAVYESLARRFAIIGFARTKMTDDAFRDAMTEAVRKYSESRPVDEEKLRTLRAVLRLRIRRIRSTRKRSSD